MVWNPLLWWIGSVLLVGAELLTGTFYLLAVAIAFAAGGLAAWAELSFASQLTVAALVGVVSVALLRRWKARRPAPTLPANLDLGQPVHVAAWRDGGRARVNYRGSQWDAELESAEVPREETLYIAAVRGSVLILSDRPPKP